MRIAILANSFDERSGGAGRIAAVYIQALRARGHEVRTWGAKTWFGMHARANPIQRLVWHVQDLGAWEKTVQEIIAWQPDVLWTHNLTGCGFATPSAVQKTGIQWIHALHDVQLVEPSGQIRQDEAWPSLHRLWRTCWSHLRQKAFGQPTIVMSPTQWLIRFHQEWKWFVQTQHIVIPNPLPEIEQRHLHQVGRVLYVGRLETDKGFDTLLQAWKGLEWPNKNLRCIGDGSLRQAIQGMQTQGIEILGWKTSAEVLEEMALASVVVVPSRILENQPTVILEAMASGCQIIATENGGIPETLQGGGRTFPIGDEKALLKALEAVYSAPETAGVSEQWKQAHRVEVAVAAFEALCRSKR